MTRPEKTAISLDDDCIRGFLHPCLDECNHSNSRGDKKGETGGRDIIRAIFHSVVDIDVVQTTTRIPFDI